MLEEKVSNAIEWFRNTREKFLARTKNSVRLPGERLRVGLALSGGFARGIAHIGVLRALHEGGIPIDAVAGTSVGALIGTCYCAGASLDEMQRVAAETNFTHFGRWTPSWLGLATNQRLEKYVERLTAAKTFEELTTPLAIAATDISAGVTVYYTQGPIGPPLRGSCAYPGLFVPIQYEDRMLVDGFLTATVPIEGPLLLGADIVVAVHLEAGNLDRPRTVADVISRSFTIIQHHADVTWRQQADVIIEPDVSSFVWDDFSRSAGIIAAGEAAGKAAIPEIRALLEKKQDSVA